MKLREFVANTLYWFVFIGGISYLTIIRNWNILLSIPIAFVGASIVAILTMYLMSLLD